MLEFNQALRAAFFLLAQFVKGEAGKGLMPPDLKWRLFFYFWHYASVA